MSDPAVIEKKPSTPNIMQSSQQVSEALKPKPTEPTTPNVSVTPKPADSKPDAPKFDTPEMKSSDILRRESTKTQEKPQDAPGTEEIQIQAELDKITDPAQRAVLEKKLKDLESGYNKKYQTLAQQRKDLEAMQAKISTWTPQRLAEELRKPEFVQAMQALQQTAPPQGWEGSPDDWSSLSDSEKQQFQQMRQEHQSLQAQMQKMLQAQEDTEIKKIYPDFEPQVVDEAIHGLREGTITASRADIWKVVNHDKNVEKGYQFGYEDGYRKALEKLNGTSMTHSNPSMTQADEVPDEVRKGGFSSIAMWRLGRSKNGQTKR